MGKSKEWYSSPKYRNCTRKIKSEREGAGCNNPPPEREGGERERERVEREREREGGE